MKKAKIAIGVLSAVLSVGALAACDNTVKYSKDGIILEYDAGSGKSTIYADDILKDYYNDSSKYQLIFDSVYSIVVRNYFNQDPAETITEYLGETLSEPIKLGKPQMGQIETEAQWKVDADKDSAKTNADNNNSSYKKEFESILSSKGVENEEELKEMYIEELQKEKFDENFYKYHLETLKSGDETVSFDGTNPVYSGYFKDMLPYHVSHILVKLEDGSSTNYANGTISEANAKKLYSVVNALAEGKDSFGTIALANSEDTGSRDNYGDLGIMDYNTGYVNEFKLGVYAFKNFVEKKAGEEVAGSRIDLGDSATTGTIANELATEVAKSFDGVTAFPTIDFDKVFVKLNEVANVTKDEDGKAVIGDSSLLYPRNIIYNKYLNRHSVAVITSSTHAEAADDAKTGFHTYTADDHACGLAGMDKVLSVKVAGEWTPILCARAGTADYQGIHFIVVNRSPFTAVDAKGVKLQDYYTTFYPGQNGYPIEDANIRTYVNFSGNLEAQQKRARDFTTTLKSFDSDKLNKYIFKKYFDIEGIKFADSKLEETLTMWITRGLEKKSKEAEEAWEKTWADYIDTIRKQNSERTKLVSQACRIAYSKANSNEPLVGSAELADMIAAIEAAEIPAGRTAEELIKNIRVGSTLKADNQVTTFADLFKKEGALCNDGQAHI